MTTIEKFNNSIEESKRERKNKVLLQEQKTGKVRNFFNC